MPIAPAIKNLLIGTRGAAEISQRPAAVTALLPPSLMKSPVAASTTLLPVLLTESPESMMRFPPAVRVISPLLVTPVLGAPLSC